MVIGHIEHQDIDEKGLRDLKTELDNEYRIVLDTVRHLWMVVQNTNNLPWSQACIERFKLLCATFESCVNGMFRVACIYTVHFMPFSVTGDWIQLVAH